MRVGMEKGRARGESRVLCVKVLSREGVCVGRCCGSDTVWLSLELENVGWLDKIEILCWRIAKCSLLVSLSRQAQFRGVISAH